MFITRDNLDLAIMAVAAAGLALTALAGETRSAETAQLATSALNLKIDANCDNGTTVFKVKNTGNPWPKSSTFAIYRIGDGPVQVISKRRMRLRDGQNASFKIKPSKNPTGALGIWVKPSWYERPFRYDATVSCR